MKFFNLKKNFTFLFVFIIVNQLFGQIDRYIPKLTPVSPTAYQFIKYGEIPINDYTGIPSISIPIYKIGSDGAQLSVDLTYHAGGLKVAEEASWVGLGWNMNFGSIAQIINDRDDLGAATKFYPDFCSAGIGGSVYTLPHQAFIENPPSNFNPLPGLNKSNPSQSYLLSTGYNFQDNRQLMNDIRLFENDLNSYDSEPDMFKVNLGGVSLTFMKPWNGNEFVVLNKKNYKVELIGQNQRSWKITDPSGVSYYFEEMVETKGYSLSVMPWSGGTSSSAFVDGVQGRYWVLTKIISLNGKNLTLNYDRTSSVYNHPSVSQSFEKIRSYGYTNLPRPYNGPAYRINPAIPKNVDTSSLKLNISAQFTNEEKLYPSTVTDGTIIIKFYKSNRLDIVNDCKLDSVDVIDNKGCVLKRFRFSYGYFKSQRTTGGGYYDVLGNNNKMREEALYRLKLTSFQESGISPYVFSYSNLELPPKDSYAVDYWGNYNGANRNKCFVPDPRSWVLFSEANTYDSWLKGNSMVPNEEASKAGILIRIDYPAGGSTVLDYELNKFDKDGLTGISEGNGLRVKSITSTSEMGQIQKKYTYTGGVNYSPLRLLTFSSLNEFEYNCSRQTLYPCDQTIITGKSFYVSSQFGCGSGVGYSKVVESSYNDKGRKLGYIEKNFYNNAELSNAPPSYIQLYLPVYQDIHLPSNGTMVDELIYSSNDVLQSKKSYKYHFVPSDVYYGIKTGSVGSYAEGLGFINGCYSFKIYSQNVIGYYPIFSGETLLDEVKEESFFDGYSVATTKNYFYNTNNLLINENTSLGNGNVESESVSYHYAIASSDLFTKKMWSDYHYYKPTEVIKYRNSGRLVEKQTEKYSLFGLLPLLSKAYVEDSTLKGGGRKVSFDMYDSNGNLLQYTSFDGKKNCFLWDSKGDVVIAKLENSSYADVAYTSFEDSLKVGWSYNGGAISDDTAPMGKWVYSLVGGSITWLCNSSIPYEVSYWLKDGSGTCSIQEAKSSPIALHSINGWTKFKCIVDATSIVTISGNGVIDELRAYPQGSKMVTYDHRIGVGVSAIIDENGIKKSFHYDNNGRLKASLDHNGKVQSAYNYGSPNFIIPNQYALIFNYKGGQQNLWIEAVGSWSVSTNASWLSLGGTSGINSGNVTVSTTMNYGDARVGEVVITQGDKSFKVYILQQPSFTISVPSVVFVDSFVSNFVNIYTDVQWSVSSNVDWLELTEKIGTGNGRVYFYKKTEGAASSPALLTISSNITSQKEYVLIVPKENQKLYTAASRFEFAELGGAQSMEVISNEGIAWNIAAPNWMNVSPSSGVGYANVSITCQKNTGSARTGAITLSGNGLKQTVEVSQTQSSISSLSADKTSVTVPSQGYMVYVYVSSNPTWSVQSVNAQHITATKMTEGMLGISCTTNMTGYSRFGIVTITNGTQSISIQVNQNN